MIKISERITITIKPDFKNLIDKIVEEKKYDSMSSYVKSAIRKDLETQGYIEGGAPE